MMMMMMMMQRNDTMMERTMTTERGDKRQKKNVISTYFYYHQLIDHYPASPPEIKDGMLFKKSFAILSLNGMGGISYFSSSMKKKIHLP